MIVTTLVNACPVRHYPEMDNLKNYHSIFTATVESVKLKPPVKTRSGWVIDWSRSDLTPPYIITISNVKKIKGPEPNTTMLTIGPGCGWPKPKLGKQRFFQKKEGGNVVPLGYFSYRDIERASREVNQMQNEN